MRCSVKCNKMMVKISFLDPRYKEELSETKRQMAKDQLKAEYLSSLVTAGGETEQMTPLPSKPSLSGLFATRRKTGDAVDLPGSSSATADPATPEQLFSQELARFESVPQVHMNLDIRLWWKERVDTYPRLAALARKY
ncbi:hypothetical protein FOCC_FOCC014361 [Frankliniella occidentalis]|nr:hypothetical protein FOCC_FOCC014361 [Frankliniella occidentalis]